MNEIVRNAVDVPGNADRIAETQKEHDPEGHPRKKVKHPEEISGVKKGGENRDRIPARVRKDPGIRSGAFDGYKLA